MFAPIIHAVALPELKAQSCDMSWLFDSKIVQDLTRKGLQSRMRASSYRDSGTFFHEHQTEDAQMSRFILSLRGSGLKPGRRFAEITSTLVTTDGLEDPIEQLHVTIFGPRRSLFHRQRIFEGHVESREDALTLLEHLRIQTGEDVSRDVASKILLIDLKQIPNRAEPTISEGFVPPTMSVNDLIRHIEQKSEIGENRLDLMVKVLKDLNVPPKRKRRV